MPKIPLVIPMSRAAIAVGADGLIVETHHDPSNALCDGQQSLNPKEMAELLRQIGKVAETVGKKIR